jgi:hypothetical protein
MTGLVSLWRGAESPLGEFKIEVTESGMRYSPSGQNEKNLPGICADEDLMHEVSKTAQIYKSGYDQDESVYTWVKEAR